MKLLWNSGNNVTKEDLRAYKAFTKLPKTNRKILLKKQATDLIKAGEADEAQYDADMKARSLRRIKRKAAKQARKVTRKLG